MSAIAAIVRRRKEKYPAEYCAHPDCLRRVVVRGVFEPCPKHPVPQPFDARRDYYTNGQHSLDCSSDDTAARMEYTARVQGILLATTRSQSHGAVLTESETQEMESAYSLGLTADGLAARFMARDKQNQAGAA